MQIITYQQIELKQKLISFSKIASAIYCSHQASADWVARLFWKNEILTVRKIRWQNRATYTVRHSLSFVNADIADNWKTVLKKINLKARENVLTLNILFLFFKSVNPFYSWEQSLEEKRPPQSLRRQHNTTLEKKKKISDFQDFETKIECALGPQRRFLCKKGSN